MKTGGTNATDQAVRVITNGRQISDLLVWREKSRNRDPEGKENHWNDAGHDVRGPRLTRGVINLRGRSYLSSIPDKFELETIVSTERTCIIVVESAALPRKIHMGSSGFRLRGPQYPDQRDRGTPISEATWRQVTSRHAKLNGDVKILLISTGVSTEEMVELDGSLKPTRQSQKNKYQPKGEGK